MKRQPQAEQAPAEPPEHRSALVDVPSAGLAADKLQCPGGIVQTAFDGRLQPRSAMASSMNRYSIETTEMPALCIAGTMEPAAHAIPGLPATAMNKEQQRRWLL